MNKIGFQNFRRFKEFNPLEYKGITFLVGRNNSGKSTLVKALLLLYDYLRAENLSIFSFGNKVLEDANIVTYGRAKNKNSAENQIGFYYEIDGYTISLTISGDDDNTFATVIDFIVSDLANGLEFAFKPYSSTLSIRKKSSAINLSEPIPNADLLDLEKEQQRLKAVIEKSDLKKSSKEYIDLLEELSAIVRRIELVEVSPKKENKSGYEVTTNIDGYWSPQQAIEFLLQEATFIHDQEFVKIQQGEAPSEEFENYRGLKQDNAVIERSFTKFSTQVADAYIVYLGANPTKQSALFPIRDRNNSLAQAIHDFYQLRIIKGEEEYNFIERWMKVFEVGDTLEIAFRAGEAYEVNIISDGQTIPLADKGMGSIQAMLILFRMASIIRKRKLARRKLKTDKTSVNSYELIVIEEPEITLHPALQSKLTDLFYEVYITYQLRFIIETHSEYMIRRSQVLVAEKQLAVNDNENPFCVYYFPSIKNQEIYSLTYDEFGVFDKNFGVGFFDEASVSTLELLRLKRKTVG